MRGLLRNIRSRLDFATVASAIVIVAVLGGGGAIAFLGSGTLQKGNKLGILQSTTNYETIRTLNGYGSVQARCQVNGTDQVFVRLHNDTGQTFLIPYLHYRTGGANPAGSVVSPDANLDLAFATADGANTMRFHIGLAGVGAKAPQADVIVNVVPPTGDDCDTAQVAVFALNTEE